MPPDPIMYHLPSPRLPGRCRKDHPIQSMRFLHLWPPGSRPICPHRDRCRLESWCRPRWFPAKRRHDDLRFWHDFPHAAVDVRSIKCRSWLGWLKGDIVPSMTTNEWQFIWLSDVSSRELPSRDFLLGAPDIADTKGLRSLDPYAITPWIPWRALQTKGLWEMGNPPLPMT